MAMISSDVKSYVIYTNRLILSSNSDISLFNEIIMDKLLLNSFSNNS